MCISCCFVSGVLYYGTKDILVQGVDVSPLDVDWNVNIFCEMKGTTSSCVFDRRVFVYCVCFLQ
jgi:hypothetical protein